MGLARQPKNQVCHVITPKRVTALDIYEGADKAMIEERYRRNSLNQRIQRLENKTLWKCARTDSRSKKYLLRADREIEEIDAELSAISSANSKYRNAVDGIDEACDWFGMKLTSEGIDMVRLEIQKE